MKKVSEPNPEVAELVRPARPPRRTITGLSALRQAGRQQAPASATAPASDADSTVVALPIRSQPVQPEPAGMAVTEAEVAGGSDVPAATAPAPADAATALAPAPAAPVTSPAVTEPVTVAAPVMVREPAAPVTQPAPVDQAPTSTEVQPTQHDTPRAGQRPATGRSSAARTRSRAVTDPLPAGGLLDIFKVKREESSRWPKQGVTVPETLHTRLQGLELLVFDYTNKPVTKSRVAIEALERLYRTVRNPVEMAAQWKRPEDDDETVSYYFRCPPEMFQRLKREGVLLSQRPGRATVSNIVCLAFERLLDAVEAETTAADKDADQQNP